MDDGLFPHGPRPSFQQKISNKLFQRRNLILTLDYYGLNLILFPDHYIRNISSNCLNNFLLSVSATPHHPIICGVASTLSHLGLVTRSRRDNNGLLSQHGHQHNFFSSIPHFHQTSSFSGWPHCCFSFSTRVAFAPIELSSRVCALNVTTVTRLNETRLDTLVASLFFFL